MSLARFARAHSRRRHFGKLPASLKLRRDRHGSVRTSFFAKAKADKQGAQGAVLLAKFFQDSPDLFRRYVALIKLGINS